MSIRYRNRERRLERTLARIEAARRTIAGYARSASEHEAWWRRQDGTLDAWRNTIAERQGRQPSERPAMAARRFRRWTSGLRLHPRVLRLRVECWWLMLKLGARRFGRGPEA